MESHLKLQLANLHDVFLNASLQRDRMLQSPMTQSPEEFLMSDRGRFERTWLTFLYVLVECWRSKHMTAARDYIRSVVPNCGIDDLLNEGEAKSLVGRLRDVRDYMCHRDRRQYWDEGRWAVAHGLQYNMRLHSEFGRVLLMALQAEKALGA